MRRSPFNDECRCSRSKHPTPHGRGSLASSLRNRLICQRFHDPLRLRTPQSRSHPPPRGRLGCSANLRRPSARGRQSRGPRPGRAIGGPLCRIGPLQRDTVLSAERFWRRAVDVSRGSRERRGAQGPGSHNHPPGRRDDCRPRPATGRPGACAHRRSGAPARGHTGSGNRETRLRMCTEIEQPQKSSASPMRLHRWPAEYSAGTVGRR